MVFQAAKRFDEGSIETIQRAARGLNLPWGDCSGLAANHPAGVLSFIGEIVDCVPYDDAYRYVDRAQFSLYGEAKARHFSGQPWSDTVESAQATEIIDWAGQAGYIFGPWCAVVVNIRPITETIPWKGSQGWFDIPESVVAKWL